MILIVSSCWLRIISINIGCFFFKKQLNVNLLRFERGRSSKALLSLAFYIMNFLLLYLSLYRFSNHRIFKKSIKNCQTWLIFSHRSIELRGLMFWTIHRISSFRSWFWSLIILFWNNLRLKAIFRNRFILSLFLLRKFLRCDFSIFNVFIHSVNKIFFLTFIQLFPKILSFSFKF